MLRVAPVSTLLELLGTRGDSERLSQATRVGSVAFVVALTALSAQVSVSIPLTPVPLTLQPMVVLMAGLALGPRLGMASQFVYLAIGVAGLPVFAAAPLPPGVFRLLGPSGGFLMAYPFAAYLAGLLGTRGFDRRYLTSLFAMASGMVVIYAAGTVWLALFARVPGAGAAVGWPSALAMGVYPFLLADALKLVFASAVLPGVWRLLGQPDASL